MNVLLWWWIVLRGKGNCAHWVGSNSGDADVCCVVTMSVGRVIGVCYASDETDDGCGGVVEVYTVVFVKLILPHPFRFNDVGSKQV